MATSEFGTARAVTAESVDVAKDDGSVIRFDPRTYDQWGLGYSGTGYKGQGKTQPQTAAVYDNPYAWDARAAYVIGTRHRDDYRLFVSRDLVPDLEALAEQILRQRDDRGSSLRFATAGELQVRQDQLATAARATMRAALGKSREVRTAKAAREREQQRQQAAVEKTLAQHRAALTQSAQDRKKLAAAWRGGAEDTTALARLVTSGWEAARAIAGNPALLAALREEDPDQASEVEAFARQDRGMLIAAAQRRMPPHTPAPDPEPDPEPPSPGMRR